MDAERSGCDLLINPFNRDNTLDFRDSTDSMHVVPVQIIRLDCFGWVEALQVTLFVPYALHLLCRIGGHHLPTIGSYGVIPLNEEVFRKSQSQNVYPNSRLPLATIQQ